MQKLTPCAEARAVETKLPTGAELDAADPVFRERPHELLDQLRQRDPTHRDVLLDRVVLTRAADVSTVLNDRTFSSDPFNGRSTAYSRRTLIDGQRDGQSMLFMDDPDHARLRALVAKAFNHRAIESWTPRIRAIADKLLEEIDDNEPFDLIEKFASPLPVLVIAALLGVDDADASRFRAWTRDIATIFSPVRSKEQLERFALARAEMEACISRVMDERSARPRADLISELVIAEDHGGRLSRQEVFNTCRLLIAAGNATMTDFIGNGVVALLRNSDQLARLRDDPTIVASAVEEILRFDCPVTAVHRQALTERNIEGCPVEAGQSITMMLLAANHDPAVHERPHDFNIDRDKPKHWSFGGGAHFCLGASLARVEGQIALCGLLLRFPHLRLCEDRQLVRNPAPGFSGYESVWVDARRPVQP